MAKYNITRINKITSGTKRGIIDVDIAIDYPIQKHATLLDMTFDNGSELSDDGFGQGIITESGRYQVYQNNYIENLISTENDGIKRNPIAEYYNKTRLLLNEFSNSVKINSLSGSYNYSNPLTEEQKKAIKTNPPFALQLITEKDLSTSFASDEKIRNYNQSHSKINVQYVLEKDMNHKKAIYTYDNIKKIYPLYDLKDLAVKSAQKKEINSRLPKNIGQFSEDSKNEMIDIYHVFEDKPLDMCQYKHNSFILTVPTSKLPYYLSSDLDISKNKSYTYKLDQKEITTVLYKRPEEYQTKTYGQYLSAHITEQENDKLMKLFERKHQLTDVDYNFIIDIDQNDLTSDYEDGNIFFTYMKQCKNIYDAKYTMNMTYLSSIDNCREYCGVLNSGTNFALKYYDNVNYNTKLDDSSINEDTNFKVNKTKSELYPYQKIEYFHLNSGSNTARHKSNLFSIKIKDTGLNENENDNNRTLYVKQKIKNDIKNNIRQFVDHICPANTQLFDTIFL